MKLPNKIFTLVLMVFVSTCSISYAKQKRSQEAKDNFKYSYPCPSNGNNHGACPGYVIDHIIPLDCNGADAPSNMQWQNISDGKAKDKWERKGCSAGSRLSMTYENHANSYYTGSRGGCYTLSASGKKSYVDHSFCGR
jgi:hypothetical protein